MQQTLHILAQAAATAEQKGFVQTQHQLLAMSQQLTFIASQNALSPFYIEILKKVALGIQTKLNDSSQTLNDEALKEECQGDVQALFNSRSYIQELEIQSQKLAEANRLGAKFVDRKKNEAMRLFNENLRQLRAKAELSHAELLAFNEYLRAMLERDFAVNNLPKAAQPKAAANTQGFQAPNMGKMFKGFSELLDATNGGDKEKMKSAGKTFVGSILGMIVEMIASVCTRFAPSIAPLIGNLAKLAKGAFSQWFDVSMEDSGSFQGQAPAQQAPAQQAPAQQTSTKQTAAPSTPAPTFSGASGVQSFLSNNLPHVRSLLSAFRQAPALAATPTPTPSASMPAPRV